MTGVSLGVALWSQATDWAAFSEAATRAEDLGFDHIWTWDHLYAIFGDPQQPILEGYAALAALARTTRRARIGLFVGANTFRNPGLAAKAISTIDDISGGRAVMGIGAAWFELEHKAFGFDFGTSAGQRLDWLAEAVPVIRHLLDGREVSSDGSGRYRFDRLRLSPLPIQRHLPLMIGGSGPKKTLPIVAQWADIWNAFGAPGELAEKDAILRGHCERLGRDPAAIERSVGCKITIRGTRDEARRALEGILRHNRLTLADVADDETFWTGTAEDIAGIMTAYRAIGFSTFIVESPAPYDAETLERLIHEVKPMVDAAPDPGPLPGPLAAA